MDLKPWNEYDDNNIPTIWEFSNSNQTNQSLQWKGSEKYFLKKSIGLRVIKKWDEKLNSNENSNQTNQSLQWKSGEKYFLKKSFRVRLKWEWDDKQNSYENSNQTNQRLELKFGEKRLWKIVKWEWDEKLNSYENEMENWTHMRILAKLMAKLGIESLWKRLWKIIKREWDEKDSNENEMEKD